MKSTFIAALAVGSVLFTFANQAEASPIKLMISVPSVPSDIHTQALTVFKNTLNKEAPGQFNVQIYNSSSLYAQGADTDAVERGNLQMTYLSFQVIADRLPQYSILTTPYLFRSPKHYDIMMKSAIGNQLKAAISKNMNMQLLSSCYLGTRELNLRHQMKIEKPADLKGIKLRMPNSQAWLFMGKALGANPTPMPFSDVYLGLQTGTIDAQDNPLPTDYAAKFYEVTKQITMTNHLVDAINLVIGNKVWNKLNVTQKKDIQDAADKACHWNNEKRLAKEKELLTFFKKKGLTITYPDIEAFRTHVQKIYAHSPQAKDWPKGWLQKINAMGANLKTPFSNNSN